MMAHKPGSRKGQVHEAFEKEGPEAATTLATTLGLAFGTVRSWLGSWAKGSGVTLPKVEAPKTEPTPRQRRVAIDPSKRRVYDVANPNVHGTVIEEGEQVSAVRWDTEIPWGQQCYVSNKYLRDVKKVKGG